MTSALLKDGYKVGRVDQYPANTEMVYSNFTARYARDPRFTHVVFLGLQYLIKKYLIEDWNTNFFWKPVEEVLAEYTNTTNTYLGIKTVDHAHIRALHKLGYLPIEIRALPEGTRVPIGVPMFTIWNTHRDFYWLPNMLETLISCTVWQACTSATIADKYRETVNRYAEQTGAPTWFTDFQCHDFSMRGMSSLETAMISGAAHLLSHKGTDTLPALLFLRKYYGAGSASSPIGFSVPATEHSVMCMGGQDDERETYRRLLQDVYPTGVVSVVSDTWDFWKVVTETLPSLKDLIMKREGKLVVRPDSGDPVLILCGDPNAKTKHERKGLIEVLWDIFGGTVNEKGYKELDPHIGAIYGDSITLDRADNILFLLMDKGFASSNVVFGVGSYTYQYNTRDTFGFAMKATAGFIDGEEVHIFKDPKTDKGHKKSAKGFLAVTTDLELVEGLSFGCMINYNGPMETVFRNGRHLIETTLEELRARLRG